MAAEFDFSDWERQAKREVARILGKVFKHHAGEPVKKVKAALESEGFSDPELSQLAQAISDGKEPRVA